MCGTYVLRENNNCDVLFRPCGHSLSSVFKMHHLERSSLSLSLSQICGMYNPFGRVASISLPTGSFPDSLGNMYVRHKKEKSLAKEPFMYAHATKQQSKVRHISFLWASSFPNVWQFIQRPVYSGVLDFTLDSLTFHL